VRLLVKDLGIIHDERRAAQSAVAPARSPEQRFLEAARASLAGSGHGALVRLWKKAAGSRWIGRRPA